MDEFAWFLTLSQFLAGSVAGYVTIVAWRYRAKRCGLPLVVASGAVTIVTLSRGIIAVVDDLFVTYAFLLISEWLVAIAALGWVYIAVEYTDTSRFKQPTLVAVFVGCLLVDFAIVMLDPVHHRYLGGPAGVSIDGAFTPQAPSIYFRFLFGATLGVIFYSLFIRFYLTASGVYRRQSLIIMAGGIVALITGLVETLGDFNILAIGIAIGSIGTAWAIFWADFLEVNPVARETLMEHMDDAVIALDTENRITDINPEGCALFDVDRNVVGSHVTDVLVDFPILSSHLDTHNTSTGVSLETNDEVRHYHLSISPIVTESSMLGRSDRTIVGRIVVLRDITEKERQRRELERQNERLDRFASVVSHDLRNPLTIAQGNLELAEDLDDSKFFDKVRTAHERMETMIDELLTMARADTAIRRTERVQLHTIIRMAWQTIETTGATLDVSIPESYTVDCDPDLLGHVFVNLFRNAIEHNDVEITVTVGLLEHGDGFFVEDDGRGIPPSLREQVFEHGFTMSEDGVGVGLSIVSDVIEAHGWNITLSSDHEDSTRFEISVRTVLSKNEERQSESTKNDRIELP